MTDAPKRIHLDGDSEAGEGMFPRCFENPKYCSEPAIEYIRADLVEALEAEVTYPDFIHSILCDVQNYDTTLHDYARAVSSEIRRAFRAALHSTEASHDD